MESYRNPPIGKLTSNHKYLSFEAALPFHSGLEGSEDLVPVPLPRLSRPDLTFQAPRSPSSIPERMINCLETGPRGC